MMYNNSWFLYHTVACLYSRQYKSEDFNWGLSENLLKQIDCFYLVESVRNPNFNESNLDYIVEKLIIAAGLNRALCEKIKISYGLREIILGKLHDAGIVSAQAVDSNFVLTLDLDEGQIKDDKFYRKVMVITFENISNCSIKDSATYLVGLFVSRHHEDIVDGKLSFLFEMWNDKDNTSMQLSLCCNDVKVESKLVND
ncbi:MAG: hypothetical protein J1F66_02495 [Clostridiales bacterium]|nr:hypothetical protein [Clostridiales bacterium]